MIALLSSCATALSGLQTDAQKPNPVNGIVVGSFLVEPVPEWERPSGNYWLSIWRRKPAKEPEHIRRQREAYVDGLSRVISSAVFGHPYMSTGPQRPIMYTAAGIEDNFQDAIKLLQGKGWSESAIEKLRKSLIASERD